MIALFLERLRISRSEDPLDLISVKPKKKQNNSDDEKSNLGWGASIDCLISGEVREKTCESKQKRASFSTGSDLKKCITCAHVQEEDQGLSREWGGGGGGGWGGRIFENFVGLLFRSIKLIFLALPEHIIKTLFY